MKYTQTLIHVVAGCMALCCASYAADNANTKDAEGTHAGATEEIKNDHSPKDICMDIVMAAKKNNFKSIEQHTFMGDMNEKVAQHKLQKAHDNHMAEMKSMTCGEEKIEGDHATVEAKDQKGSRLIPFIQKDGQWKFDVPSYMSKYHVKKKSQS